MVVRAVQSAHTLALALSLSCALSHLSRSLGLALLLLYFFSPPRSLTVYLSSLFPLSDFHSPSQAR